MAFGTAVDRLLLNIEVKLHNLNTGSRKINQFLKTIGRGLTIAHSGFSQMNFDLRALQGMLLGVGLSFLFTGMALARFFKTALNSIFQTFLMVEGEGGAVNDQIHELLASLAFLKFSLVEAFVESGALQRWIDLAQNLIDRFNSLDDSTKAWIVDSLILGAILSTALMVIGQTMLGLLGIITLISFIGLPVFILLGVILAGVIALIGIWNSDMTKTEKVLWTIVVVLGVIAAGLILLVGIAALPFVIIIGFVIWLLSLFAKFIDLTGSMMGAFKMFGVFVLWILALVGDAILATLIEPIIKVIHLVNLLISSWNQFTGSNIPLIKIPDWLKHGMLTTRAEGLGESIIARAEADRSQMPETEVPDEQSFKDRITNIINIDGIVSDDSMDQLFGKINEKLSFYQGSPQQ